MSKKLEVKEPRGHVAAEGEKLPGLYFHCTSCHEFLYPQHSLSDIYYVLKCWALF
jgi:hypothetical protein